MYKLLHRELQKTNSIAINRYLVCLKKLMVVVDILLYFYYYGLLLEYLEISIA